MPISPTETTLPRALAVSVNEDTLSVDLSDGRSISVPASWYPRLAHARAAERGNRHLIADGEGIHWTDLDEDISVVALLACKPSAESRESLRRWLAARTKVEDR